MLSSHKIHDVKKQRATSLWLSLTTHTKQSVLHTHNLSSWFGRLRSAEGETQRYPNPAWVRDFLCLDGSLWFCFKFCLERNRIFPIVSFPDTSECLINIQGSLELGNIFSVLDDGMTQKSLHVHKKHLIDFFVRIYCASLIFTHPCHIEQRFLFLFACVHAHKFHCTRVPNTLQ